MSAHHPKLSRIASAGFSLVELMVALTIGSGAHRRRRLRVSQSRDTYALNESTARLQEEARYALSLIEPDVQLAGYYGFTNAYDDVQLSSAARAPRQRSCSRTTRRPAACWRARTIAATILPSTS